MASQGSAFEKRERAAEEVFFRQEERLHMIKRLEGLVKQGKLDQAVLDQVRQATSTDVHHATGVEVSPGVFKDVPQELGERKEYVYAHVPGAVPQAPREYSEGEGERLNLAPHTDMGPGRWAPGGDSVFQLGAVAEPAAANAALPAHEAARLARLSAKAEAMPAPTFLGYKVGAGTPARTMFWGSMLAIWGTAALVAASARTMGGGSRSAEGSARDVAEPSALGARVAGWFAPWRERAQAPRTREEVEAEEAAFVRRLKERMVAGKA